MFDGRREHNNSNSCSGISKKTVLPYFNCQCMFLASICLKVPAGLAGQPNYAIPYVRMSCDIGFKFYLIMHGLLVLYFSLLYIAGVS